MPLTCAVDQLHYYELIIRLTEPANTTTITIYMSLMMNETGRDKSTYANMIESELV